MSTDGVVFEGAEADAPSIGTEAVKDEDIVICRRLRGPDPFADVELCTRESSRDSRSAGRTSSSRPCRWAGEGAAS